MSCKNFIEAQQATLKRFEEITNFSESDPVELFEMKADGNKIWDLYLESFPDGTNEIFRERREYDCCSCRNFIRSFGNTVTLKDGKINTLWDIDIDNEFKIPFQKMHEYIVNSDINRVKIIKSKNRKIGDRENYEELDSGKIYTWNHFHVEVPIHLTAQDDNDVNSEMSILVDIHNVFRKSLDEISIDSLNTVLELINNEEEPLYKGKEYEYIVKEFLRLKTQYVDILEEKEKDIFVWTNVIKASTSVNKIKNSSIGELLINISEGMDLDIAVKKYEDMVAPTNYKRAKPIYSKRKLEEFEAVLTEAGYLDSLPRRHATLSDVNVNNVLYMNRDILNENSTIAKSVFDEMKEEIPVNINKLRITEEISIDKFISDILPGSSDLKVLLESRHYSNMVSLITSKNAGSKSLFKWDNNFSWSYSGNITDSDIKKNVKHAGGNVNGVMRFSIQWNDGNTFNNNDFDAHCFEENGNHIYFNNAGCKHPSSGCLDVDIMFPVPDVPAVENIIYTDKSIMPEVKYYFGVHVYSYRGGIDGFRAELEIDGDIYQYEYRNNVRTNEMIPIVCVQFKDNKFTIIESLETTRTTVDMWGLKTKNFIPVTTLMKSPNYWNDNNIGNEHYFFMLKDCANPESPNGFYNEYIKDELYRNFKNPFEALGSKMKVETVPHQLSGIGFSTTQKNDIVVQLEKDGTKLYKIMF